MDEAVVRLHKAKSYSTQPRAEKIDHRIHISGVNGIDSMSPYDIPQSKLQFRNITEVINQKSFTANFPQSYTPIPGYFKKHGITPYFNPGEDSDYARGALTVAGMIELTSNNQPWQLVHEQDTDLVILIAETYLNTVKAAMHDPNIREYATKVKKFLNVMEDGRTRQYVRQGKINPNALDFITVLKKLLGRG